MKRGTMVMLCFNSTSSKLRGKTECCWFHYELLKAHWVHNKSTIIRTQVLSGQWSRQGIQHLIKIWVVSNLMDPSIISASPVACLLHSLSDITQLLIDLILFAKRYCNLSARVDLYTTRVFWSCRRIILWLLLFSLSSRREARQRLNELTVNIISYLVKSLLSAFDVACLGLVLLSLCSACHYAWVILLHLYHYYDFHSETHSAVMFPVLSLHFLM